MKKIVEYEDQAELIRKLQWIIKDASVRLTGPGESFNLVKKYAEDEQESFIVIFMDGAHNCIDVKQITKGLLTKTIIHPREVFRPAIMLNSAAIILCHNHPSGNMEPSPEDLDITRRIKEAGEIIGISVLDHMIISKNGFMSMLETGVF